MKPVVAVFLTLLSCNAFAFEFNFDFFETKPAKPSNSPTTFRGSFEPTPLEIITHKQKIPQLVAATNECMQSAYQENQKFYEKTGLAMYYGESSEFYRLDNDVKIGFIANMNSVMNYTMAKDLVSKMQVTSCVGFVLMCLKKGFESTDQAQVWAKLNTYTRQNEQDGSSLEDALQKLGWKILYWNPDPTRNDFWDSRERNADPANQQRAWGEHSYLFATVKNKGRYNFNKIDDKTSLVGFQETVPEALKKIPYYVGLGHGGYHVFAGSYGTTIEAHSSGEINDRNIIETGMFNPLAEDGGPHSGYKSGLIAIPPGY